jgi:hypothetical protein
VGKEKNLLVMMVAGRVFHRVTNVRKQSHFDPLQGRLLRVMLIAWVSLLVWRERLVFGWSGASCAWPTLKTKVGVPMNPGGSSVVHVAVIADPQLTDHTSYRWAPKGSWLLAAVERLSDVYMARACRSAVLPRQGVCKRKTSDSLPLKPYTLHPQP